MNAKKSSLFVIAVLIIVLAFLIFPPKHAQSSANPEEPGGSRRRNEVVKAIERVMPAVVNIGTERIVTRDVHNGPYQNMFDEFINAQKQQKTYSLGSGFIIDKLGLVVTNAHVVNRATRIMVTLTNGKAYDANVVADDQVNDIALLSIKNPPPNLQAITCDNTGKLYLGETVIAVGNPFGLDSSISVGTLSGKMRKFTYKGRVIFSDILQTDAIVYPGNSGGPLINIDGEVIGMNMSVYENAPGIGFAIPLFRIENVIAKWMIPERFKHLYLGIIPGQRTLENDTGEIIVADIIHGSPAAEAGLRKGDVIVSFNGKKLCDLLDLSRQLIALEPDQAVTIETASGRQYKITPRKLTYRNSLENAREKLGLDLAVITPELAREIPYALDSGLVVCGILPNTPSEVKRGDLLVKINSTNINSATDLAVAMNRLHYNDTAEAVFITPVTIGGKHYLAKQKVKLPVR